MRKLSIRTLAGGILTAAISVAGQSALAGGEVTVASWGGSYQDAQSKALFQPVAEAMGITVKEETYKGIGQVRTKVAARKSPLAQCRGTSLIPAPAAVRAAVWRGYLLTSTTT